MSILIAPNELPGHGIVLSDKQRRRLEAEQKFPRRVPVSAHTHAYVLEEILSFSKAQIAKRDSTIAERDGRPVEAA